MPQRLARLSLVLTLALLACSEDGTGPGEKARFTIAGLIETDLNVPVSQASVWIRVWDTAGVPRADRALISDAAGHFSATIPMDTMLAAGFLQLDVQPVLGSGLGRGFGYAPVTFNNSGQADTAGVTIQVTQVAPPIPNGNPATLDAALLAGDYSGETVPPQTIVSAAYLDLSLTPAADSVHGRYDISFSASTTCGNGLGDVAGQIRSDTLFLLLISDSFPGWGGVHLVNDFVATTYSVEADTLILHYPAANGPCSWGSPAPLRLVRQ